MCGRYALELGADEKIAAFIKAAGMEIAPGEVRPTDLAPVIVAEKDGKTAVRAMRWGYPGYPDQQGRKPRPLINAKAETAPNLPTWADSLARRRCVVPATGYYEWQHGGPQDGQKYLFHPPEARRLYMAGVYRGFADETGSLREHFAILTTAATDAIADVHTRMPLILTSEECRQWLGPNYAALLSRPRGELTREETL